MAALYSRIVTVAYYTDAVRTTHLATFLPSTNHIVPLFRWAVTGLSLRRPGIDICEIRGVKCDLSRVLLPNDSIFVYFNPLNPELNPICYLLALLGTHHFLHVSRIRVKILTFRRLMSYIYGAPILDVSRSHTTTQHSR